jgi:hypothetical protein
MHKNSLIPNQWQTQTFGFELWVKYGLFRSLTHNIIYLLTKKTAWKLSNSNHTVNFMALLQWNFTAFFGLRKLEATEGPSLLSFWTQLFEQ